MAEIALETHGVCKQSASKSATRHFLDAVFDFTGGVAGGVASVYVGQPLDTVKVKMQTFPKMYTNAWLCFRVTLKQEGIVRGLYAGTVPSLAAQVSENAVLFMAYGLCQRGVMTFCNQSSVSELSILQNATSGCFAAFFSSFVLCPTELVKCKLQAMKEMKDSGRIVAQGEPSTRHIGPWSLTKQIVRENGLRGLFRGLVPTFMREMPGYFFFFGGYEVSRTLLTPPGTKKEDLSSLRTVVCGGIGGMSLWAAIFPSDVIKSRVQIQSHSEKPPSFFVMLVKIGREEGVRALYKGLGPTLLRTFPATGALFLAYENTKKGLGHLADGAGIV